MLYLVEIITYVHEKHSPQMKFNIVYLNIFDKLR